MLRRPAASILALLFALLLGACAEPGGTDRAAAASEAASDAEAQAAIRQQLADQVARWNAGDVEGFMQSYLQSDSLRFASGGRVLRGWEPTLRRYRAAYPDEASMGVLRYDSLDVRVLAPTWAVVFGRWGLSRSGDHADLGGLFTLLLERRPDGWRIVHDHTSSAPRAD